MNFIKGHRTYILVFIGALVWVGQQTGILTPDIAMKLFEILGIGAAGTLRAAISNPPA